MNLKLRYPIGIFLSLALHSLFFIMLFQWHPGFRKDLEWGLANWSPFSSKKIIKSKVYDLEKIKGLNKKSSIKIIFPDILLSRKIKKINNVKEKKLQLSLKSILSQVEKFPERLDLEKDSNRKLSSKVVEVLTSIIPSRQRNGLQKKVRLNLNSNELKLFRNSLEEFLSKRWEVPIHLRGSDYAAFVKFEIKKNGLLLDWEIEKSTNILLEKTLKDLLKNLQFLPSLPESYPEDSYKFGIRFAPSNFQ